MNRVSRREMMTTAAAGAVGMIISETSTAAQQTAPAAQQPAAAQPARAFRGAHQPKPLPFDPSKLHGISEKLIRSHWENNYGGAVKALNAVERRLGTMLNETDLPAYVYGDLKREELHRTGSVVLHEHYFGNLGGDGTPSGAIVDEVKATYGDWGRWEAEFRQTGAALGGGSGWVILGYNLHTGAIRSYWSGGHSQTPATGLPLLVMDMYEHAYQMDYGAAAATYIDAFFANVNWEEVNRRLSAAHAAVAALRPAAARKP